MYLVCPKQMLFIFSSFIFVPGEEAQSDRFLRGSVHDDANGPAVGLHRNNQNHAD